MSSYANYIHTYTSTNQFLIPRGIVMNLNVRAFRLNPLINTDYIYVATVTSTWASTPFLNFFDLDLRRALVCGRLLAQHRVLNDLADNLLEHLLDALARLRAGLYEQHLMRVRPLLTVIPQHFPV